ncbi:MAG: L-aspartate oxidase [Planctomycetes bacterium]|nr:L-aspartate oxidase [Planctomycetota bacterium]
MQQVRGRPQPSLQGARRLPHDGGVEADAGHHQEVAVASARGGSAYGGGPPQVDGASLALGQEPDGGGGVAGARAAIEAARFADVLLICKGSLGESVTRYAQGGIAAARAANDSPQQHLEDTVRVGCELNRPEAVDLVVRQASQRIDELIEWGIRFDATSGNVHLAREGGHTVSRILHAHGDATGRELSRVLLETLRANERIRIFEQCYLLDLIVDQGRCVGAVTYHDKYGHQLIWSAQTILATGGCGRLYRETTNAPIATGDGYAVAYRAGVRMADMEMVQFHPTTLYVAGASRALISEAVRGEGALLIDRQGERFMPSYHPDAELAPRDVVSRAIVRHMRDTRTNCVYLDVRHIPKTKFEKRFPFIARLCADFQIDVGRDPIPVRPAAHYMIGGCVVDLETRTNLEGFLCCGEAACSGLHGANRLASNSLLEGLVFGAIAGAKAGQQAGDGRYKAQPRVVASDIPVSQRTELDLPDISNSLRSLMWRNVGIERTGDRLAETRQIIEFWGEYVLDKTFDWVEGWEMQNMLTLGRLMAIAAHARPRSLGVHFRSDDDTEPGAQATDLHHIVLQRTPDGPALTMTDLNFTDAGAMRLKSTGSVGD